MAEHNCGNEAEQVTCWTPNSPARRFHRCSRWQSEGGCNYWRWIDAPLPEHYRLQMNRLIEGTRAAQQELEHRQAMIMQLNSQIVALRQMEHARRNAQLSNVMGSLGFGMTLGTPSSSSGAGTSGTSQGVGPSRVA